MSTNNSTQVPGTHVEFLVNLVPGIVLTVCLAAGSLGASEILLLGREPFSRAEIQQLAESDDIRALAILNSAFKRRLALRSRLGPVAPAELDEELSEALLGIERLDEGDVYDRAHEVLEQVPATCRAAVTAREVLARQGDISIIREALGRFFEEPEVWGRILGEAARATDDLRLADFREMARPAPEAASPTYFQTLIERELANSTDEWKLADMLFWAEENPSLTAARILSWIPTDSLHEGWVTHLLSVYGRKETGETRLRALAALGWRGATDRVSVLRNSLRDEDPTVAAVTARALEILGGKDELARLTFRGSSEKADDPKESRQALERIGSVEAIERMMKRKDRALSIPALGRLRRSEDPEIREAAERALVALRAPGSLIIMMRYLEQPEKLRALIPSLAAAPLAAEAFEHVSRAYGARPDVQAALFAFYRDRPSDFRSLLSIEHPTSRRRIHAAMALSDGNERLPILADSAVHDATKSIRLMAFRGLSEADIGPFAARLHRAAGDDDPDVRWEAGLALAPTGEDWAVRLLAAEMNPERSRDRIAFHRVLRRLPAAERRRLLATMYWDETGNPFTDYLHYTAVGGFSKDLQERVWTRLAERLDESPFILFMAAGLHIPEAAKAVYSRLQ
jgi:HEAT repeat protein